MITYDVVPADVPQYAFVAGMEADERHETVPGGTSDVSPTTQTCEFRQLVFPVDQNGTLLRLREPLKLVCTENGNFSRFTVENWGLSLDGSKADELPRILVRTFLQYLAKADDGILTTEEQIRWIKILDQVDFTQFTIDRAAPHYVEGRLTSRSPVRVMWSDGTIEKLSPKAAGALLPLDLGDEFSALAKLGRNNTTLAMECVNLMVTT